jgi:DNA repair ATPase RecN
MKEHIAEMVANYEQSAEAFKDAVNVAHRTNESSENAIIKVTNALENLKTTNEALEKVIATVATKQANVDKIVANIKEMNSTIEALQQLESVLNRIAKK